MTIRAKARRSTPRRRTVAAPARNHRPLRTKRAVSVRKAKLAPELKPAHNGVSTFSRALRYLGSLSDYERLRIVRYTSQNFDLDRMRHLLKRLGNPHDQFKSIHIAGTKGKGSTCAMVASMLQACGYKVGLYTSPHLIDIRERIRIDDHMIPHAELARWLRHIQPIANRMRPMPTYFAVLTAAAFKYFAHQEIDIAVVETGL